MTYVNYNYWLMAQIKWRINLTALKLGHGCIVTYIRVEASIYPCLNPDIGLVNSNGHMTSFWNMSNFDIAWPD